MRTVRRQWLLPVLAAFAAPGQLQPRESDSGRPDHDEFGNHACGSQFSGHVAFDGPLLFSHNSIGSSFRAYLRIDFQDADRGSDRRKQRELLCAVVPCRVCRRSGWPNEETLRLFQVIFHRA